MAYLVLCAVGVQLEQEKMEFTVHLVLMAAGKACAGLFGVSYHHLGKKPSCEGKIAAGATILTSVVVLLVVTANLSSAPGYGLNLLLDVQIAAAVVHYADWFLAQSE